LNCFEFIVNKLIKNFISLDLYEEKIIKTIQIILISNEKPKFFRQILLKDLDKLITLKIKVISVSRIRTKLGIVRKWLYKNKNQQTLFVSSQTIGNHPLEKFSENSSTLEKKLILTQTDFVDYQIIKARDWFEEKTPEINLGFFYLIIERELVGKIFPGKLFNITGVYMMNYFFSKKKEKIFNKKTIVHVLGFRKCFENLNVNLLKKEYIFDESFLKFIRSKNLYNWIISSICPDILGFNPIKAGLAVLLFGRNEKKLNTSTWFYRNINMLLIGNYSQLKSSLFGFIKKLKFFSSNDSYLKKILKELELPKKNEVPSEFFSNKIDESKKKKEIICIDELEKISPIEIQKILEYIEKGGDFMYKKVKEEKRETGVSLLAGTNEKYLKKFQISLKEKGPLKLDYFSKFDLIFHIKEKPDKNQDKKIARYFFKSKRNKKKLALEFYELNRISFEMLKKYLRFTSFNSYPVFTENAFQVLRNAYLFMRINLKRKKEKNKVTFFTISIYQLESLVAISEALGKMKMTEKISSQEILEAVNLFQKRFLL